MYFPRVVLGIYLTMHFAYLSIYSNLIFGTDMPFDARLSPIYGIIPNILNLEWCIVAPLFLLFLMILSICLAIEFYPKVCAIVLWYGWVCLINRNLLINNPGIAYIGWMLLSMLFVENGRLNRRVFWCAWFLMAAGYTASGLHKFMTSPSWTDGSALQHVLEGALARDNILVNTLLKFPSILRILTWFTLFLEISFLPLGVFYKTRFWYCIAYIALHVGILATINFTDLTWGVLCIHILTIDERWYHQYWFVQVFVDWVNTKDKWVYITVVLCGVVYGMIMLMLVGPYNVLFCSGLVGLAVTLYGIYLEKSNTNTKYVFICNGDSCSRVLKSEYAYLTRMVFGLDKSSMFNIPNTYYGVLFYMGIIAYQFYPFSMIPYHYGLLLLASSFSILLNMYLAYLL